MGSNPTVYENIDSVLQLLDANDVPTCVVGELALNYYNVPRVVHDLAFCVRKSDLSKAAQLLRSTPELFVQADEEDFNVYTEHRRGLPRYRILDKNALCVVLFPDQPSGCISLLDSIIPNVLHRHDPDYSDELDDIPPEKIPLVPFPMLGPLLTDSCLSYMASKDVIAAMAIDGLIDGMDLDEQWCTKNLRLGNPDGLGYVLSRVRGKAKRIDYFQDNTITRFIANEEERGKVLSIPGRDMTPSCDRGTDFLTSMWERILVFLNEHKRSLPHSL